MPAMGAGLTCHAPDLADTGTEFRVLAGRELSLGSFWDFRNSRLLITWPNDWVMGSGIEVGTRRSDTPRSITPTHAADRESSLEVRLRGPQSIMVRHVEAVINTLILKAQAPV